MMNIFQYIVAFYGQNWQIDNCNNTSALYMVLCDHFKLRNCMYNDTVYLQVHKYLDIDIVFIILAL